MRRLMLYDRLGNPLGELAENDVFEAVLREEINGEHSLTITTTQVLEKGIRLLYEDGRGKWREFAVAGVDAEHASGNRAIGTYYCIWSMQEDLQGVTVSVMPGVQSPTLAANALTSLLSSQSRWARGTVTNINTGGASMYDRSAWEALTTLVEVWGGEVDAAISIGTLDGVIGRAVDLYSMQGNQTASRRFDFAHDLQSVKRTLPDTPFFCRISPRGAGEETDAGGHGRKITIESVNSGRDWLEYAPMVDTAKLPNGSGYIYPTLIVENSDCKTPTDLKTWAQGVLADYCTPKVTYEIDVLQAGIEGVDVSGVSLGDAVQVVDRKFSPEGIRIEGRVRSITTDLLNERDISIVIGDAVQSIASQFAKVDKSLAVINNDITTMSTAEYIDNLLTRINAEINATGGYTYITQGQGIRTYDTAVSDPLVGSEASAVVEIKGGSIRIANTKTAQGEWEWKTVFTSGHIAADLITAAAITAGYIGNSTDGAYWDLDTSEFQMMKQLDFYDTETLKLGLFEGLTLIKYMRLADLLSTSSIPPSFYGLSLRVDSILPSYTPNQVFIAPSKTGGSKSGYFGCAGEMHLCAGLESSNNWTTAIHLKSSGILINNPLDSNTQSSDPIAWFKRSDITLYKDTLVRTRSFKVDDSGSSSSSGYFYVTNSKVKIGPALEVYGGITVYNGLAVASGTKNRLVNTPNYNDRLLYSYETSSPMFGDIGSGVISEDGLCIVEIDDIFSETARADLGYQVFLQKCGQGDLWVDTKEPNYFIVQGTPGLRFDWEMKAKQRDFESLRLEQLNLDPSRMSGGEDVTSLDGLYSEEMSWVDEIERALYAD